MNGMMRNMRWVVSVAVGLGVSAGVWAAEKPKSCWDKAQTQDELKRCADADYAAADRELSRAYQEVLQKYADVPGFIAKLKGAQAAWGKYRDAEIQALFPPTDGTKDGGAAPMCVANAKTRLTEERTRQLRRWLDGRDDGDVCGGSIKTKTALKTAPKGAAAPRPPAKGAAAKAPPPKGRK